MLFEFPGLETFFLNALAEHPQSAIKSDQDFQAMFEDALKKNPPPDFSQLSDLSFPSTDTGADEKAKVDLPTRQAKKSIEEWMTRAAFVKQGNWTNKDGFYGARFSRDASVLFVSFQCGAHFFSATVESQEKTAETRLLPAFDSENGDIQIAFFQCLKSLSQK